MSHRPAELRSIALHALVADRIEADPGVVERARHRVEQWIADGGPVPRRWSERWLELLGGPRVELLAMLVADTDEARDLRQVTPFAGVVADSERWRILREVGCAVRRDQLEHVLPAAAGVTNQREFVIVGSQAIPSATTRTESARRPPSHPPVGGSASCASRT